MVTNQSPSRSSTTPSPVHHEPRAKALSGRHSFNPTEAPGLELAALDGERWKQGNAFDELKTRQRGAGLAKNPCVPTVHSQSSEERPGPGDVLSARAWLQF